MNGEVIMAHPPDKVSDLTFNELLKRVIKVNFSIAETRTKVVHKNASQGSDKFRRSKSKKITKPLHNIKVTFQVIYNFMEKLCLHDIGIHTIFNKIG